MIQPAGWNLPSGDFQMRPLMNPPTTEPPMPSAAVNQKPSLSTPGMNARAKSPTMKPTMIEPLVDRLLDETADPRVADDANDSHALDSPEMAACRAVAAVTTIDPSMEICEVRDTGSAMTLALHRIKLQPIRAPEL